MWFPALITKLSWSLDKKGSNAIFRPLAAKACLFPSTTTRLFSPMRGLNEEVQLHQFRYSPARTSKVGPG